jgi:uncharacterized protein (DUF983 family)
MSLFLFVHGASWAVDRRIEENADVRSSRRDRQIQVLLFTSADGEVRRSEIAENFPEEPTARLLESVWKYAEVIHAGDPGEMTSRGEMVVPGLRDVLRAFSRALLLRCPNCGGPKVIRRWFALEPCCAKCGLQLDRGEMDDNVIGGMYFNIVLAELLFAAVLLIVVIAMWPHVPWAGVEYSLIAAMIIAPIIFYPASRLMWLALDLLLRPPDATEMESYANAAKSARKSTRQSV